MMKKVNSGLLVGFSVLPETESYVSINSGKFLFRSCKLLLLPYF